LRRWNIVVFFFAIDLLADVGYPAVECLLRLLEALLNVFADFW